jgi:hypothetical protein
MRRLAILLLCVGLLALASVASVASVDASTSYIARLGSSHGAARLTMGGPNSVYVNASGLTKGAWTETLYQGTCSRLSTRTLTLAPLTVGSGGSIARTNTLTSSQAGLTRAGVIRLTHGAAVVCGSFASRAVPRPSPSYSASPSPSPSPSPSYSASPSPSRSTSPSPTPPPTPTPTDPKAGTVLLDVSGRGASTTAVIAVPANWEIDYVYD